MIQAFARNRRFAAPRSVAAVLLALVLNAALIPCTMAIEVVEDGHDCCPPELRLDSSECCEVDDGNVQARAGTVEFDKSDTLSPAPDYAALLPAVVTRYAAAADPPDPPDHRADLNALFCVYLK